MDKPREWWIKLEDRGDNPYWKVFAPGVWLQTVDTVKRGFTHVIEYSAYKALEDHFAAWRQTSNESSKTYLKERDEARAEVLRYDAMLLRRVDQVEEWQSKHESELTRSAKLVEAIEEADNRESWSDVRAALAEYESQASTETGKK